MFWTILAAILAANAVLASMRFFGAGLGSMMDAIHSPPAKKSEPGFLFLAAIGLFFFAAWAASTFLH